MIIPSGFQPVEKGMYLVSGKYRKFYCKLCSSFGLGRWWFVMGLGILGAVATIVDTIDLFLATDGPILMQSIWRNRLHTGSQSLVTPAAERDLKLMVAFLSLEHYVMMICGVFQANPAMLMPWLFMEALIISLEALFFGMRLFAEGLAVSRLEVIMTMVVLHNWFQVFCFFRKILSVCDL